MTTTQLETGNKLKAEIETLTTQKTTWENAIDFKESPKVAMPRNYSEYVSKDYINFEVLKSLTLSTINTRLLEAQKELAAL